MNPSPLRIANTWLTASERWYRGQTRSNLNFSFENILDDERSTNSKTQEGPGIYFSSARADAASYAYPHGFLISATIRARKWLPLTGPPKRKDVERLIRAAPQLDDTLTDWDAYPARALSKAIDSMVQYADTQRDALMNVWADFYRRIPGGSAEWCRQLVKLGYDGVLIPKGSGITHAVVFNPSVIQDAQVELPREDTP